MNLQIIKPTSELNLEECESSTGRFEGNKSLIVPIAIGIQKLGTKTINYNL